MDLGSPTPLFPIMPDVGWLVVEMGVEMGVLHSIVEEGEGAWLGICFGEASHMSPKKILLFSLKDILIKD